MTHKDKLALVKGGFRKCQVSINEILRVQECLKELWLLHSYERKINEWNWPVNKDELLLLLDPAMERQENSP